MKATINLGLLVCVSALALGCGSQSDPDDSQAALDEQTDGDDLAELEEAITIQYASGDPNSNRLIHGYQSTSNRSQACSTGNTECTYPVRVGNTTTVTVCSDDATLKSYMPQLVTATETAVSGSTLTYHAALANPDGGCSPASATVKYFSVSQLSGSFGADDARKYVKFSCTNATDKGLATAPPRTGFPTGTIQISACNSGQVDVAVNLVLARGATGDEDSALLKRMTRHGMAAWLGGGGQLTPTGQSPAANASTYSFTGRVSNTPAVLSAGEKCRFQNYQHFPSTNAVISNSAGCANN